MRKFENTREKKKKNFGLRTPEILGGKRTAQRRPSGRLSVEKSKKNCVEYAHPFFFLDSEL
jgi:hypothetical protein